MENKKVSVIIPVYNAEDYLTRCLDSVVNQSYQNLEIILVNDGSKDKSLEICKFFEQADKRIKVIDQENSGVSLTRNVGLELATGEYVEFVDSDDYLEPNCVETMVKNIKDCDMVICGYVTHNINKTITKFNQEKITNYKNNSKEFMKIVKDSLYSVLWNKLYRRELINIRFSNEYFIGEDVIFNLNYLQNCKNIKTIKECLYNYNFENVNSIMHTKVRDEKNFTKYWSEIYRLCNLYFEDKEYVPILNGMYIRAIMSQISNITIKQKLKFKDYKKIFKQYRENPILNKVLKNYNSNVFYKRKFFGKISILIFKFKFKFLFYIVVYMYKKIKHLS